MFRAFRSKKQDEIQWVQDPNQNSVDNLYNVRHEASRHFREKKKKYLKAKIKVPETNCTIKKKY
jgi:hypothetical protein